MPAWKCLSVVLPTSISSVFIVDGVNAAPVVDGAEGFVFVDLLILVLALGVHGEPAFLDAFLL